MVKQFFLAFNNLYLVDAGSNDGVYINQNATSWTSNSDARLKENVETITDSLEKIKAIRGVHYNWIHDESQTKKSGVIAQELQGHMDDVISSTTHYPSAEKPDEDAPERLGVRYTEIVPYLINAIKELSAKVEALEAK